MEEDEDDDDTEASAFEWAGRKILRTELRCIIDRGVVLSAWIRNEKIRLRNF